MLIEENAITLNIPALSLICFIGDDSVRAEFIRKNFTPSQIVSLADCRQKVMENEQTPDIELAAFELLHFTIDKRLKSGQLVVVDASFEITKWSILLQLSRKHHVPSVAIVFKFLPENANLSLPSKEGFKQISVFHSAAIASCAQIVFQSLESDKKHEKGPFDIIGDVHGCFDELEQLILKLGYQFTFDGVYHLTHPANRKLVFVGDLVDRGPKVPAVLRFVMDVVESGMGFSVNGNHDDKLKRKLQGRSVTVAHGLAESLTQLATETDAFKEKIISFLEKLPSHYLFDGGKLAVAHGGLKEKYLERSSKRIRDYCMYGETTGEMDEFGLPVRADWAANFKGKTIIVYGHTPVKNAEWVNNTINIDTGCVFGGKLTALRYPEREIISVDALKEYYRKSL